MSFHIRLIALSLMIFSISSYAGDPARDQPYLNQVQVEVGPSQEPAAVKGDFAVYAITSTGRTLLGQFPASKADDVQGQNIELSLGPSNGIIGNAGDIFLWRDSIHKGDAPGGVPVGRFKNKTGETRLDQQIKLQIGRGNGIMGQPGDIWISQAFPAGGKPFVIINKDQSRPFKFTVDEAKDGTIQVHAANQKFAQFPSDAINIEDPEQVRRYMQRLVSSSPSTETKSTTAQSKTLAPIYVGPARLANGAKASAAQ